MGSAIGVMKIAAKRLGLTLEQWQARWAAGERWCSTCRRWLRQTEFGRDKSRRNGIAAICINCRHSPAYRARGTANAAMRRARKAS